MRKIHVKKYSFILFIILFSIYYIVFPASVTDSCKIGVMLWFNQIFPALFIFTILSNLLISTNVLSAIPEKYILLIIYFLGCIFGFPIGAKLTCDFYEHGYISPQKCEYISAFSNHFSMPFIITYAFLGQLGINSQLWIYMPALYIPSMIGVFLILSDKNNMTSKKIPASRFKLDMQIVDSGIIKGFETLIKLCGYIVLFSVIARVPHTVSIDFAPVDISFAFFEATNGINMLCGMSLPQMYKIILCTALLSFGGISCILQTKSIFAGTQFRLCKYILLKAVMSISSVLITVILLGIFNIV